MRSALIVLVLILGACASEPKVVVVPQEVAIPVTVKCKVKYPEKPSMKVPDPESVDTYTKVLWVLEENVEYRLYAAKLEATLSACADPE